MAHSHAHDHGPALAGDAAHKRRLEIVMLLTGSFMVVEVVGGWWSGSLALMADAVHMFADSFAMLLSYAALWLAGRSVSASRTYGFKRAELLAAFVNSVGLLTLAAWIVAEGVERMGDPRSVQAGIMLPVAVLGLLVNLAGIVIVFRSAHENLSIRATLWHITGDMLGSVGAIVAGTVVLLTGWTVIDPIISLGIAALITISGVKIMFDSGNLLMDSVPREIDAEEVSRFLAADPNVRGICDLHIWGVSSNETMLTAHLVVAQDLDRDAFLADLSKDLRERFNLAHMTVQLESNPQETCHPEW